MSIVLPFRKAQSKVSPLALPPFGRKEDTQGMTYSQLYYTLRMPAPNVAPMQRQSLGQPILRHRHNDSHYTLMQPYNRFAPGYPFFKGTQQTATSTRPTVRPLPTVLRRGPLNTPATGRPGSMGPMKRFNKALQLPVNDYTPETY